MILAVDTSLGSAVAVIGSDEALRGEATHADALSHAEVIGTLLERAVEQARDTEITAVVAGMGPGPFTGLRIGIATARTFALGRGVDVVPVPSHFAPALTAVTSENPPQGAFAIVTDARRREVAVTVFAGLDADGIPAIVRDTVLVPRVDIEAHLAGTPMIEVTTLEPADLARIGARAQAAGRVLTSGEPLYLRQPDVTMPGAPKKVGL